MNKIFKRKTDYFIAAFLVVLVLMLAFCEAKADGSAMSYEYWHDSNAGVTPFNDGFDRIGVRYRFKQGASVYFSPFLAVGGSNRDLVYRGGSFEIGVAERFADRWQGQLQLTQFDNQTYGGFTVRRFVGDGVFKLAIGGTYWIDGSPGSGSNFTFNLGFGLWAER